MNNDCQTVMTSIKTYRIGKTEIQRKSKRERKKETLTVLWMSPTKCSEELTSIISKKATSCTPTNYAKVLALSGTERWPKT